MKRMIQLALACAGSVGLLLGTASTAQAIPTYRVTFDTSSLAANPAAPFYLNFQFLDGSGLGNGNNTATLGNFDFGGGSVDGVASTLGGVSGDFASGLTLDDSSFFSDFLQAFTPGSIFAFDLSLTSTVEPLAPDAFVFAILDGSLLNITTTNLANNSLFYAEIGGAAVLSAGTGDFSGVTGGVTGGAVAVPDSGAASGAFVLLGLCGVDYLRRRRRI